MKFLHFSLFLLVISALLDPADQNQCGSATMLCGNRKEEKLLTFAMHSWRKTVLKVDSTVRYYTVLYLESFKSKLKLNKGKIKWCFKFSQKLNAFRWTSLASSCGNFSKLFLKLFLRKLDIESLQGIVTGQEVKTYVSRGLCGVQ
jgi:hypothetical protein